LFVNGRRVGRGPAPGDPRWQPFDSYDLAPFLARGPNVIATVCAARGHGPPEAPAEESPGGLLFQAAIAGSPEDPVEILSDGQWRVRGTGDWCMLAREGAGEVCDLSREPRGWMLPDYPDGEWPMARRLGPARTSPWERLVPRQLLPLAEEEIAAVRIVSQTPHHVCLDFGRVVVGYPRVRAGAHAEGTVELIYGDWLDAEGQPVARGAEALARDRVVLPGGGSGAEPPGESAPARRSAKRKGNEPVTWQPYGRRVFRYMYATLHQGHEPLATRVAGNGTRVMQWDMRPGTVDLSMAGVGYPLEDRGEFRCSDQSLEEIWTLGRDTLRRAMQEQFEKCPAVARFQTVADTRVAALANYYAFGDYRLAGRAIWQLALRSQPGERPDDDALWVLLLADYYHHSGDERLVRQLAGHVRARLAWFHQAARERGLAACPGERASGTSSFLEALPMERHGESAALNALYLAALRAGTDLACRGLLTAPTDATNRGPEYEHRAQVLQRALNWTLWSEGERAFADARTREGLTPASACTNWLMLALDACEPGRRGILLRQLMADREAIVRLPPAFQLYVAESLFRLGHPEEALDLIRAVWGEMLRRGATTCWEDLDWDAPEDRPPQGSICHASSSSPTYLLPAYILGVVPQNAGWGEVRIAPCEAGLSWAEGRVPTLRGLIVVSWRRMEEGFELFADLPPRVNAEIWLPWQSGDRAEWDGHTFWPAARAERGLELDAPVEETPHGLRLLVSGPRQLTLRSRACNGALTG
jgi:hypothetical protein